MAKILIVEDNKESLDLMTYLLDHCGHSIITASDGEEAIEKAKQHRPDLIICDIQLPKLNGYEIAKILKNDKLLKHVPLVSVTAYAMVGDRNKVRDSGFDAYISKPIDLVQFVVQIDSLLPAELRSNKSINLQPNPSTISAKKQDRIYCKALLVDDFSASRELYKILLESIGVEVTAVSNVNEALSYLQKQVPDFILSEFHLPDNGGLAFLKLVRNNVAWKSIAFIFMSTTHPDKNEMQEMKILNVTRFILSPIDTSAFFNIIKSIMSMIKDKNH